MAGGDHVEDRIISIMKRFGYTGSDARTYIALLQTNPATGYELAARGGVPRSAIYGVLKRLEQSGLVNALQGKPARYVPMPPERLIKQLEGRFASDVENFREAVQLVAGPDTDALTWTISGYESVMAEAERLIESAERSIVCSLWRKEAEQLRNNIDKARARGVDVTLFSFTKLPDELGQVFSYGIDARELATHWSRQIILITDRTHLLVGGTEGTRRDRAVISEEQVLVDMAVANLVLDITLFGERNQKDTSDVVGRLTHRHAPIQSLLDGTAVRT